MSRRGVLATGRCSAVGVLLVGALVGACGSNPPTTAPAEPPPVSTSASAAITSDATPPAATMSAATMSAATTSATITSAAGAAPHVPWSQVGPGWFLVLGDSPAAWKQLESAPPPPSGTLTLWLISPTGAGYALSSWSTAGSDPRNLAELDAWSGDGRHALFAKRGEGAVEMDLTTGVLRQVSVPQLNTIGFTSPAGANLVATVDMSTADGTWSGQRLVRFDLNGKPQVQLAEITQPELAQHPYGGTVRWLYSADGATVYLDGTGGLRIVSNGGGSIRTLPTFETPDTDCAPLRWWDERTILAECSNDSGSRLWLVQAAAGSATPLTALPGTDAVGLGYDGAVRLGSTVFAQHLEGCGVVTVHRVAPSGVGTRVKIPQSLSNDRLVGAVGSKLAIESTTECGSPSWFGFYDPSRNTVQKVIPDGPGQLGAGSALAFP